MKSKKKIRSIWLGICVPVFLAIFPVTALAVPEVINYQGYLTDADGKSVNGDVVITFRIWDDPEIGTELWSEMHAPVTVREGVFNVMLGTYNPITAGILAGDCYLGMTVGTDSEMIPRMKVTSAAYAIRAGYAESVAIGSVTTSSLSETAVTETKIAEEAVSSDKLANGSVTGAKVAGGTLTAAHLQDGAAITEILDNDGAGSGLDADTLDGLDSVEYAREVHEHDASAIVSGLLNPFFFSAHEDLVSEGYLDNNADSDLLTLGRAGSQFWSLYGNDGTNPEMHFMGTLDPQPLELRVNGQRALRLEPGVSPNVIGGYMLNFALDGVIGGTVSGGGETGSENRVTDSFGTVGGGIKNQAGDGAGTVMDKPGATIGGGEENLAAGRGSTVGGGLGNQASADYATIAGGGRVDPDNPLLGNSVFDHYGSIGGGGNNRAGSQDEDPTNATYATVGGGGTNWATGQGATIGGGFVNEASGYASTISGGEYNISSGAYSTIAGGGPSDPSDRDTRNRVTDNYGTVSGGGNNQAGDSEGTSSDANFATVGGGHSNIAGAFSATVAGGAMNTANAPWAAIGGGNWNKVTDENGTVAGGNNNQAGDNAGTTGDANFATVGGGQYNNASGEHATVGGGTGNKATGHYATVSGGGSNTASGSGDFVGGGDNNTAGGWYSVVGGGHRNETSGEWATVGGGQWNTASGEWATVPGGSDNLAAGEYSFAAGYGAKARGNGAFRWADSTPADFDVGGSNDFRIRASGGVVLYTSGDLSSGVWIGTGGSAWNTVSDRNAKDNFSPIDGREVLTRLAAIPITVWNYKSQDASIRHMGPVAQDFSAAFGLGESDRHISTIDADGVALAAIQGLYKLVQEKDGRISTLEERNLKLEERLAVLEDLVQTLAKQKNSGEQ